MIINREIKCYFFKLTQCIPMALTKKITILTKLAKKTQYEESQLC